MAKVSTWSIAISSLIVYHRHMRRFTIIAFIMIAMLLSACTVTENLVISGDGSMESRSDIHAEQFFVDVLTDFAEFLPEDDASIMDSAVASFGDGLGNMAAIESSSAVKTGENEYSIAFSFTDLQALLSEFGVEGQSLLEATGNSLTFHLDISNYPELKEIVPFLADPNFEVYGPEYNQGMTEDEYLEMISFLLGEDGPEAIRNGLVSFSITVPGTITGTENAVVTGECTASYSFPIIAFLLLNEPLSFSIEWQ